jgi:hypothetical protein
VSHSTWTHQGRVDSQLLVVGSQIASLIPDLSFACNLCCKCPNGSCKAIFDIYASRSFQRYKKHLKARCFDPCNRVLNFWESRRTPKSPFQECECHPHTPSKWGCIIEGLHLLKEVPDIKTMLKWMFASWEMPWPCKGEMIKMLLVVFVPNPVGVE